MLVAYAPMRQATTLYWKKQTELGIYISDAAAAVSWPNPNVTYVDTLLTLLQTQPTNRNKEFVLNLFMYKFIKHIIKDPTVRLFSGNLFSDFILNDLNAITELVDYNDLKKFLLKSMYSEVFDLLKGVSNIDERKKGGIIKHPLVLGSVSIFKDSITTTEEQIQKETINDYLQACLRKCISRAHK